MGEGVVLNTRDLVAWHSCGHQLCGGPLGSAPDDSPVWATPMGHLPHHHCGPEAGTAGCGEGPPLGPLEPQFHLELAECCPRNSSSEPGGS